MAGFADTIGSLINGLFGGQKAYADTTKNNGASPINETTNGRKKLSSTNKNNVFRDQAIKSAAAIPLYTDDPSQSLNNNTELNAKIPDEVINTTLKLGETLDNDGNISDGVGQSGYNTINTRGDFSDAFGNYASEQGWNSDFGDFAYNGTEDQWRQMVSDPRMMDFYKSDLYTDGKFDEAKFSDWFNKYRNTSLDQAINNGINIGGDADALDQLFRYARNHDSMSVWDTNDDNNIGAVDPDDENAVIDAALYSYLARVAENANGKNGNVFRIDDVFSLEDINRLAKNDYYELGSMMSQPDGKGEYSTDGFDFDWSENIDGSGKDYYDGNVYLPAQYLWNNILYNLNGSNDSPGYGVRMRS